MDTIIDVVDKFGKLRYYRTDLRKIYDTLEDAIADKNGTPHELGS